VTLASIFTILVVTILKLIRQAAFFQGKTAVVMAVSLSLLFLVALSQFLAVPAAGPGNAENAPVGYFYLLPGVGLAVAAVVVLSQVLLLASRIPPSEEPPTSDGETYAKESKYSLAKPKSRGRPKKTEAGRSPAAQKSGGKGKSEAKASSTAEGAATT
jgi:hypothetical protein